MEIIKLNSIESRELMPGFDVRFVHSERATLAFWKIRKESVLPEHSHEHEQITQVLEGRLEITLEGKTIVLSPGEILVIPSNAIHSGKALDDCSVLDVFTPVREDYL